MEDLGVGPNVVEGQDVEMGAKGDIPKVDVQGEEDVPHFEDTRAKKKGEVDVEEEVPSLKVLSIDALLGKIL